MRAFISKDTSGNETLTIKNIKYTLESGMWHVLGQLSDNQKMYAGHRSKGVYRGFAALHDVCDANMLLPGACEEIENMDDCFEYWNRVMDRVSGFLICYADIWEDHYED